MSGMGSKVSLVGDAPIPPLRWFLLDGDDDGFLPELRGIDSTGASCADVADAADDAIVSEPQVLDRPGVARVLPTPFFGEDVASLLLDLPGGFRLPPLVGESPRRNDDDVVIASLLLERATF